MRTKTWMLETLLKTVAMSLGVVFAVWIMLPVPPVEMSSMRLVGGWILNKPGQDVVIHLEGYKNRGCPVIVTEKLIDSQGTPHMLPLRGGVVDTTGPFESDIHYKLPSEPLPDGLTTFHSSAVYSPDLFSGYLINGCFKTWTITSPQRPDVRFWIGSGPPPWANNNRR